MNDHQPSAKTAATAVLPFDVAGGREHDQHQRQLPDLNPSEGVNRMKKRRSSPSLADSSVSIPASTATTTTTSSSSTTITTSASTTSMTNITTNNGVGSNSNNSNINSSSSSNTRKKRRRVSLESACVDSASSTYSSSSSLSLLTLSETETSTASETVVGSTTTSSSSSSSSLDVDTAATASATLGTSATTTFLPRRVSNISDLSLSLQQEQCASRSSSSSSSNSNVRKGYAHNEDEEEEDDDVHDRFDYTTGQNNDNNIDNSNNDSVGLDLSAGGETDDLYYHGRSPNTDTETASRNHTSLYNKNNYHDGIQNYNTDNSCTIHDHHHHDHNHDNIATAATTTTTGMRSLLGNSNISNSNPTKKRLVKRILITAIEMFVIQALVWSIRTYRHQVNNKLQIVVDTTNIRNTTTTISSSVSVGASASASAIKTPQNSTAWSATVDTIDTIDTNHLNDMNHLIDDIHVNMDTTTSSNNNDDVTDGKNIHDGGDSDSNNNAKNNDDCIYVPGGGFSGFWFSLGRLQAVPTPHQQTYVCYSAGCLGVVATLLGLDQQQQQQPQTIPTAQSSDQSTLQESLYNTARQIQIDWEQGRLHRYDVVEAFVDSIIDRHSSTSSSSLSSSSVHPFPLYLSENLNVITTVVDEETHLWTAVKTRPTSWTHLKRLLLQTTWIPLAIGSSFTHDGHFDGAFSTPQHPSCQREVGLRIPLVVRTSQTTVPADTDDSSSDSSSSSGTSTSSLRTVLRNGWKLLINTLNVNLSHADVVDLWQMGLQYGV